LLQFVAKQQSVDFQTAIFAQELFEKIVLFEIFVAQIVLDLLLNLGRH